MIVGDGMQVMCCVLCAELTKCSKMIDGCFRRQWEGTMTRNQRRKW